MNAGLGVRGIVGEQLDVADLTAVRENKPFNEVAAVVAEAST